MRNRSTIAAVAMGLVVTACGGGETAAVPTTVEETTTTTVAETTTTTAAETTTTTVAETTTTVAAETTTTVAQVELDADQQEAAAAWASVFDSTVAFEEKVPHLEDAENLAGTIEAYAASGERMGGIALEPLDVLIDGDTATVTYDVLFGENAIYTDLTGSMTLIDGVWVVGRDEFCGFMASARTPCG
jgi:hypothetical protein